MSNRLDQQREAELQPKRIKSCLEDLESIGIEVWEHDNTKIKLVSPEGNMITFFPYSGWHTGKGIKDGRGYAKLREQLLQQKQKENF